MADRPICATPISRKISPKHRDDFLREAPIENPRGLIRAICSNLKRLFGPRTTFWFPQWRPAKGPVADHAARLLAYGRI